jgi:predicted ester cyclase
VFDIAATSGFSQTLVMTDRSLLHALFAAGDAGEWERFPDLLHDDVMVHAPFGLSTKGLPAELASWREALQAMADLRHEFQAVLVDGTMEAARCIVTGTLTGSYGGMSGNGRSFQIDQALFARTREGKIEELWEIIDTDRLLRQLGRPDR